MRPPAQSEGWTPERVATLERMWAAGASAADIAAALPGLTRSGVLGKVHRMGLGRAPSAQQPKPAPKTRRVNQGKIATLLKVGLTRPRPRPPEPKRADPVIVDDPVEVPSADGIDFMSLTNSTCRWPLGGFADPAVMFCGAIGANLNDGKPYCAHHMRVSRL